MFRMYKRLHKDWGSCNNHIMRILKRGGTIAKAFDHNGGVMLIYDYMTFDEAQDELDKIFNELRDKYGMDDSRNGDLTKVYGKGWVIVNADSDFLTPRAKMLVDKYYTLLNSGSVYYLE